jgi:membrane protease YdiL (CAAX protease family)
MHLFGYGYDKSDNIKFDRVREFCRSEGVDEEYMRTLIKRDTRSGDTVKKVPSNKGNSRAGSKKALLCGGAAILLFIYQRAADKVGSFAAGLISVAKIDPDNAFARNCVHHAIMLLTALAAVLILGRILNVDFGLGFGDRKTGVRFALIYTVVIAWIALAVNAVMATGGSLPVYDYPLNRRNVAGTLCFQLFLTGPAEELLFRALPIPVLSTINGGNASAGRGVTTETVIAAFLFAIAHMKLSFFPFDIKADIFGLLYAFGQGIVSGWAYSKSRSVIYPMFMHSVSNVLMVGIGYMFIYANQ